MADKDRFMTVRTNVMGHPMEGLSMVTCDEIFSQYISSSRDNVKKFNHALSKKSYTAADIVDNLLRSYIQKLVDDKKMLKLSEVKKMDILDMTSFLSLPENGYGLPNIPPSTLEERNAIYRLGWYAYVPCFERGAVKLNKFRYIVFEMLEMDPENQSVTIRLHDYLKPEKGIWQIGVSITVVIKMGNIQGHEKFDLNVTMGDALNFPELYTMYTHKELGWTKEQYDIWMEMVVENSRNMSEYTNEHYGMDQCSQLASVFVMLISRCNAMLELNKPSRPVNAKQTGTGRGKRSVVYENGNAPKRKIRNVGMLRIQSEAVPRKPSFETVITYKVAKWTVRGHVRRYKNGKEVYIKPAVKTRKALAGTDQMTATTIKFKKIKPKSEKE